MFVFYFEYCNDLTNINECILSDGRSRIQIFNDVKAADEGFRKSQTFMELLIG